MGRFLSTLSLRRATAFWFSVVLKVPISIHALLAESDYDTSSLMQCQAKFLSTLSLRRATAPNRHPCPRSKNFYPRSPCGERPYLAESESEPQNISIHALLAESDATTPTLTASIAPHFYPRSPCGERHSVRPETRQPGAISIHALLAESDQLYDTYAKVLRVFLSTLSLRRATVSALCSFGGAFDFYPRSPCGERPFMTLRHCTTYLFLSTLSLRRATPPAPPGQEF